MADYLFVFSTFGKPETTLTKIEELRNFADPATLSYRSPELNNYSDSPWSPYPTSGIHFLLK
jgi:hypothetical protein